MTYLFIILALIFTVLMIAQILRPFLISREDQLRFEILDEDLRRIEALMAQKGALIQTLRDLEYDNETAKISPEDYKRFKRSCERQAVGIMRELDTIHGGRDWQEVIERSLDGASIDEKVHSEDEIWHSSAGEEKEDLDSLLCSKCGTPLEEDDKFCGQCGTPLNSQNDSSKSENAEDTPTIRPVTAQPSALNSPALASR